MSRLLTEAVPAFSPFTPLRQRWLALRERLKAPAPLYLAEDGLWDAGRVHADFNAWCQAHPGRRARLAISASTLRTLVAPTDLPLADEAALAAYARLQFGHYFGAAAQGWPMATWWVGAKSGAQRGACALVDTALPTQDRRLAALQPSWSLALRQQAGADPAWAAAPRTALALVEGRALTWMCLRDGALNELHQRVLDEGAGEAELQSLLQGLQEATGGFSHAPKLVGWSGVDIPGLQRHPQDAAWLTTTQRGAARSQLPAPDFARATRRPGLLPALWLLAAVAACALAAQQALQQRDEAARLTEQAQVLARMAGPARTAPNTTPPASNAARGRATAFAQRLRTDWPALWLAVERALPPGVQLQALELDARQLRLEGHAAQADSVMQLVDRLALQPGSSDDGPREVVLTRLGKPDRADEQSLGLRFEIVRRAPALAETRP